MYFRIFWSTFAIRFSKLCCRFHKSIPCGVESIEKPPAYNGVPVYLTRLQLLIKHPVRTQLIRDNITTCQSVAPHGQTNVPKLIWFNPPHLNRDIDNCNFYVMFTLQTRKATLMLKNNLKGKSLSNSNIREIYTRLIKVSWFQNVL